MAKYKPYNYSQSVLLPVYLDSQLMPGTLEFAIHALVEDRLDMSVFDQKYNNDDTGCAAYDPKVLLKVVLLAYARGLISSRKIERALKENITFIALSCGQRFDHSTIAAFISSMKDQILPIFRDILLVCDRMNLLGGTMFALDGCKIPSNASKQWSGTVKDLKNKKEKIEKKVVKLMDAQIAADRKAEEGFDRIDRDKQIERLQKQADRIEKWLSQNEPKIGKCGKELKSNITDNDSCKMKTSHGTIQGYNSQALVDGKNQVIVSAEALGNGQDYGNVPPVIDGAKENMEKIGHGENYFEGKIFITDSNYHSRQNLLKCEEEKLDAYIPDVNFRKRDPRFSNQGRYKPNKARRFTQEEFSYDKENDRYICPNKKILKLRARKAHARGRDARRYAANKRDCEQCPLRDRCLLTKKTKRKCLCIPIGGPPVNLSKRMQEKIDTDQGRRIYEQRLGMIEPVFANIRIHKRLDRFTLRGKIKVNIQWLLYCMLHNIEKTIRYAPA